MGQTLSSPATEKSSESGGNDRFYYGLSEMQGWRISMEDSHAIELDLDSSSSKSNAFFAVYDGHGGDSVAKFSGKHVHERLLKEDAYREGDWGTALKKAFLGTDEDIRADASFIRDPSGCTAVAALVTSDGRIIVANAGDSRSVLSVKGEVKPLSFDHKPLNETESNRIRNAGGWVEFGRVNGNLALSRAIGDFEFKKNFALSPEEQIITADPDITEHQLTEEDEFLILACDGIWDCLTSQQVVNIVRLKISEGKELSEICEFICDLCLAPDTSSGAGVGCDNMTIMIVALLGGRSKEEWYDWIGDRVRRHYGFETPSEVPQVYAPSRINAFQARRMALDNRNAEYGGAPSYHATSPFGFARSLLGAGISFNPATGAISTGGQPLMFSGEDSDEGEDDIDMDPTDGHSFLASLGLRPPGSNDVTKSLRAQLDELDDEEEDEDGERRYRRPGDDDEHMSDPDEEAQQAFGLANVHLSSLKVDEDNETPKANGPSKPSFSSVREETPPPPGSNGILVDKARIEQLVSSPGGDEPSSAVKVEGLLDKSEDPIRA